jgi:ADP-heptose:LPS heptosyltransferase
VSKPLFKAFFSSIPDVNFYAADVENSNSGLFGLYQLYKNLSLLGIDAFADLHDVLRSKVIKTFFKLNRIPVSSLNKGRSERKKLTALKTKEISPIKPILERHVQVCEKLPLPISLSDVTLLDKRKMPLDIERITGEKVSKWVGIAPFATYQTKMYPLNLMKEAIDIILQKNYQIFLFGGGDKEVEQLDNLASVSDNCINIAGKLTFDQELALISNLDLMISMDSGNGHMAAMYGIPVITMWGNTHPYAGFVPFRQPLENSLLPDVEKYPFLPTSVYGNKIVTGYEECMKTINPEMVVEKISMVLNK